MLRFVLLPLLLLGQAIAYAQDTGLNQLLSMNDDTVKVEKLSVYARKVVHNDHELSRKASTAMLKTSEKIGYTKGIANGYSYLAFIELQVGRHAAATDLYDKAIVCYKKAATEATVQLSIQDSVLALTIEDNGVGLNKQEAQSGGMGLELLRRRIRALNGNIELSTEDGSGVNACLEFSTEGLQRNVNELEAVLN